MILEPYKLSNIDLNKIVYPKYKENMNKKIIFIKYKENNKFTNFVFQTPTLLNINKPEIFNEYCELELALTGKKNNNVNELNSFFDNLEKKIKSDAYDNANTWFNQDNNTINFQKIVRSSNKYDTGTIKIKLIKTNDFETIIQLNNKRIDASNIQEDCWCKMILECYAVWINTNNEFGIFFRPILVSITPKESLDYKYKFIDESDDENNFDIPDTDVNTNIFMKINTNKNNFEIDETSQLEVNDLIKQLDTEKQNNNNNIYLNINDNLESSDDSNLITSDDSN